MNQLNQLNQPTDLFRQTKKLEPRKSSIEEHRWAVFLRGLSVGDVLAQRRERLHALQCGQVLGLRRGDDLKGLRGDRLPRLTGGHK